MTDQRRDIRILVCPNAFKGSMPAPMAAQAIAEGIALANAARPPASNSNRLKFVIDQLPLADGGDGTLETLVSVAGGSIQSLLVCGPIGEKVEAEWGRLGGSLSHTAVIEMAKASGLALAAGRLDAMNSTTYGTGELMLAAVESGCTKLLVGIGGSATNDGGAGMAAALGARLLDANGREIPLGGAGLAQITTIDMTHWKLPSNIVVQAACDVDNPLTGRRGAAHVFGPQKGADPEMVLQLDAALYRFGALIEKSFGVEVLSAPGAGAAGGLGAGLMAFCGAHLLPGTEMVMNAVGFSERLGKCGLVITGEGKLDAQTASGKVIGVVSNRARNAGKPCIALCGEIAPDGYRLLSEAGLSAAFSIVDGPMSLEYAMENGFMLLKQAAERVANLLQRTAPALVPPNSAA